jgi:signal peptidase I
MKGFLKELKAILIIVFIIFVIRSSFVNWYEIPSGSMLPTLKIGDRVLVNKLSYGFMLPLMETRIFSWGQPDRGDIVVFQGPSQEEGRTLIKRVVGIGGDVIHFQQGVLVINGKPTTETLLQDRNTLNDMGDFENPEAYNLYLEAGASQTPHYILRRRGDSLTERETQSWVVPQGQLLLIGDSRDNSLDGRFWGFMDEKNVYGRAVLIPFSLYNDGSGSWIPDFRGDRWFMELHH